VGTEVQRSEAVPWKLDVGAMATGWKGWCFGHGGDFSLMELHVGVREQHVHALMGCRAANSLLWVSSLYLD
jgi:hypothetical protein